MLPIPAPNFELQNSVRAISTTGTTLEFITSFIGGTKAILEEKVEVFIFE